MEWCGGVKQMESNMLRWFDHMERKKSEEFVKKLRVPGGEENQL